MSLRFETAGSSRALTRPARDYSVTREAEVVVVGGGAAGLAAAVTAARSGARTLLLERNGFLGGVMTATSLGGICGMYSLIDDEPVQMVFGFAEEIRQRLEHKQATRGPLRWLKTASLPYDLYAMKRICDDLSQQPRLQVLLHAYVVDVFKSDAQVSGLVVRTRGGELAVRSRIVIDASGDADVCALAGAPFEYDVASLQYPTAMFRLGGVDPEACHMNREAVRPYLEKAVADGADLPRTSGGIYSVRDGVVHLNITRVTAPDGSPPDVLDPDALTLAEFEGRRQIERYLDVFRRYVPGYQDAYILDCGSELGLRETRRIVGDYLVTNTDVTQERKFPDAIAKNCWPIEEHNADRTTRWVWPSPGGYNHIPYRCLIPQGLDNVLVAGRCLSSAHDAQAAMRVTANCFSMGQAAGLAGALAVASRGLVRQVPISRIQSQLIEQGAVLDVNQPFFQASSL